MNRRNGLTLIELMATLTIVASLTVASLAAVSNLSRTDAVERQRDGKPSAWTALRPMLAADVVHATVWKPMAKGFSLRTRVLLDAATMEASHLGTTVTYQVRRIGSRAWLVRTQQPNLPGRDLIELVCSGVKAVTLRGVGRDDTQSEDWQSVPAAVVVTVVFEREGREPILYTIRRE